MKNKLNYISLFSSAGIGGFAFEKENFRCVLSAEYFEERIFFQKLNKKSSNNSIYIAGDIRKNYNKILNLTKKESDIDFLLATPPCQGMSSANHKKNDNEIKRNSLIVDSIILTQKIKPKVFVYENVRAFLKTTATNVNGEVQPISVIIDEHLLPEYIIEKRIVNLKNYGSNSSRTRTLVIGVRKDLDIYPWDLFPEWREEKTLKDIIFDLPRLKKMGENHKNDILHNFRAYDKRMLPWIKNLKEGESAFENKNKLERPHRIIDGKYVVHSNTVSDKYKKQSWDKVAPCVTTRNDQLASQNTIHPEDNRVFSVREIMRMMSIPEDFKFLESNSLEEFNKKESLIRRVLGEAVPTNVFREIAINYKQIISSNKEVTGTEEEKKKFASYYTNSKVVNKIVNKVELGNKNLIKILEPSAGSGVFIDKLAKKFFDIKIEFTVIEKNKSAYKKLFNKYKKNKNPKHKFKVLNKDFFDYEEKFFDLIIGNPPFGIKDTFTSENLSPDIYASFILHSMTLTNEEITFIMPKTFLDNPKFSSVRNNILNNWNIKRIVDFNSKAFLDARIETISLTITKRKTDKILIETITGEEFTRVKEDIIDKQFDAWLIYKDKEFLRILESLKIDYFTSYRGRIIRKADLQEYGDIPVIKSWDIDENKTKISKAKIKQFVIFNKNIKVFKGAYYVPNMTYKTRMNYYAGKATSDGSSAILLPKNGIKLTNEQIIFFSSEEFRYFYSIARNKMERTINLDSYSIKYWGVKKNGY